MRHQADLLPENVTKGGWILFLLMFVGFGNITCILLHVFNCALLADAVHRGRRRLRVFVHVQLCCH